MSAIVSKTAGQSFDKTWVVWTGRVLSAIPVLMMLVSGAMKLLHAPQIAALWTEKFGYPESALTPIGLLELAVVAVYAFPRTAPLGAVLVTAYLGGAVATHVRIGEAFLIPVILGVFAWVGLYLRNPRIRAAFPLR